MSDGDRAPRFNRREYTRVSDPEARPEPTESNEVRVMAHRHPGPYVDFGVSLLMGLEGRTQTSTVKLTGMGKAIPSVIAVTEMLKKKVPGLHQITQTGTKEVVEKYEPHNKDLEVVSQTRFISMINVTLSLDKLDTRDVGYQVPKTTEEIQKDNEFEEENRKNGDQRRGGRRGRSSRGGRGSRRGGNDRSTSRGARGGNREDRPAPRNGNRDDRAPRNDNRDDRAPTRGGRGRGGNRDDRAPRNGNRNDRAPRNDNRDDRAPTRGGRGRYSEQQWSRGGRGMQ